MFGISGKTALKRRYKCEYCNNGVIYPHVLQTNNAWQSKRIITFQVVAIQNKSKLYIIVCVFNWNIKNNQLLPIYFYWLQKHSRVNKYININIQVKRWNPLYVKCEPFKWENITSWKYHPLIVHYLTTRQHAMSVAFMNCAANSCEMYRS